MGEGELHYQDKKITLTRNELRILHLLIKHGGEVLSREKIMRALWEDENFVDDNTLTVNINRLRRKLSDAGLDLRDIEVQTLAERSLQPATEAFLALLIDKLKGQ